MISSFQITSILSSTVSQSQSLFFPNSNSLLVPLANKINKYDLDYHQSISLNFQAKYNIRLISISPNNKILITIDSKSYAIIYNLEENFVISHFNFKKHVNNIMFSNDSKLLSVLIQNGFRIYQAPTGKKSFEPLILIKKYVNLHTQKIIGSTFTQDSRFILTWGKDYIQKLVNLFYIPQYVPLELTVHKQKILLCKILQQNKVIYSLDKGGNLFKFLWVDDYLTNDFVKMRNAQRKKKQTLTIQEVTQNLSQFASQFEKRINHGRYIIEKKYNFAIVHSKIKCAYFKFPFIFILSKTGTLKILQFPLQQYQNPVYQVSLGFAPKFMSSNQNGNWLCISSLQKLIVYQWKSTTIIFSNNYCKIKYGQINKKHFIGGGYHLAVWQSKSGMCQSILNKQQITALTIRDDVIVAASLGQVVIYDLNKLKQFRRMKTQKYVQITAVALDNSCQLVCASIFDPYEIYCWHLQTSNLLQIISGHQGPINCLIFCPIQNVLVSGSWDKTVRVHDIFSRKVNSDVLNHNSQITYVAIRPDGKQYASSTLKGQIYFWEIETSHIRGIIECRNDLMGGRGKFSQITADKDSSTKHLICLSYCQNGQLILGGGKSKYICLYEIKHRLLIHRFQITKSRDIDFISEKLNSRDIKDGIDIKQIDFSQESDFQERKEQLIPGAKNYDVIMNLEDYEKNQKGSDNVLLISCIKWRSEILCMHKYRSALFFKTEETIFQTFIAQVKHFSANDKRIACKKKLFKGNYRYTYFGIANLEIAKLCPNKQMHFCHRYIE